MSNTTNPSLSTSSRIVAAVEQGMASMPRVRWTREPNMAEGIALLVFRCPVRGQCAHILWPEHGMCSDVPVSELEFSA